MAAKTSKPAPTPQPYPTFDAALRAIVSVPKSDVVKPKRKAPKRQQGRRKGK